ncbi:hypothetical protein [Aureispira anguillae]|uniref:Uncharacterized protein n=1 Tax=Aureispira anguillae TaxID=2864201 RepID=A0A915YAS3_9BACT|nr:hypothetical protein [Aureispira anguillae]BDS09526.1 hypothetical protein AsAng_0002270 [Aureispira anguillae]
MKIEISHDTLARTVYEKASAEDRMRLKVLNLIKTKHELFSKNQAYLTSDELKSIAQFEHQLELTAEEKTFLSRSKFLAQKQMIAVVFFSIAIISVLIWFLRYYHNNNVEIQEVNKSLKTSQDSLKSSNSYLAIKLEELRVKDSIHESLTERIGNDEQIIKMTNQELQNALNELRILNQKLENSKRAVEQERDVLKTDKRLLTEQLMEQEKVKREHQIIQKKWSAAEQSQKLSQKAHSILHNNETPTDAQYKEAFQLARYAWETSKSNSQAMDVLNKINNQKIKQPNSGFLGKNRPKNTYTYRQIESIIRKLDQKYDYGKLSPTEVRRRLNAN